VNRIALIVGNGFSMSFCKETGLDEVINTQSPLSWNVSNQKYGSLLDVLPRLKLMYQKNKAEFSDFDIFEQCRIDEECKKAGADFSGFTIIEARHYLVAAFAGFSHKVSKRKVFSEKWNWYRWIYAHRKNISCAVSFNYDLLLEHCFKRSSIEYHSTETNLLNSGIPLYKPHGSADFGSRITNHEFQYPIRHWVELCDVPLFKLDKKQMMRPREQALCIIPGESGKYREFQWSKKCRRQSIDELKSCTHCILLGISYWDCDRPEVK
jgi:hypothetical protein